MSKLKRLPPGTYLVDTVKDEAGHRLSRQKYVLTTLNGNSFDITFEPSAEVRRWIECLRVIEILKETHLNFPAKLIVEWDSDGSPVGTWES